MGRKTSIYLNERDLARLRALGSPPLAELIRAGLTVAEGGGPAQTSDDTQSGNGGPAQCSDDNHGSHGGPASPKRAD